MLYVKPYGRSVTNENETKRRLRVNNRTNSSTEVIRDFEDFNSKDPRILIAQWISLIDKIIRKPNQKDEDHLRRNVERRLSKPTQNDKLRKFQLQLRTQLGAHCWNVIKTDIPMERRDEFHKIWLWKLHPSGNDYSKFRNEREYYDRRERRKKTDQKFVLDFRGRWFAALTGVQKPSQIKFDTLVDAMWLHLNKAELRIDGKERSSTTKQPNGTYKNDPRGLIASRANSIASNSLSRRMQKLLTDGSLARLSDTASDPVWTEEDETQLSVVGDLAEAIFTRNAELEKKFKRINQVEAAQIIFDHYGRQFGCDVQRQEIQKNQPGLLALYGAIRSHYKRFLKNSGKGRMGGAQQKNSALSTVLPQNDEALCALLAKRHTNSVVNDLIRLGRVLHYESSEGENDGFGLKQSDDIWQMPMEEIANSRYWTSQGQAEIKRAEAFVRIWRNSISHASRAARAMVDPNSELPKHQGRPADILDRNVSLKIVGNAANTLRAAEHAPMLFGTQAKLFTQGAVTPKSFVYSTLRLLANVRNKAFHFNGRKTFVAALKNGLSNPGNIMKLEEGDTSWQSTRDAISQLLAEDTVHHRERLIAELEGAQIHTFSNTGDLAKFVELLTSAKQADFVLPKMNRLLLRLANKNRANKNGVNIPGTAGVFPEPASQVELKDPARLAKYVGIKKLYEGPFRDWVNDLPSAKLASYVEKAISTGTEEAKHINSRDEFRDLIKAKPDALPRPLEGQSIASYMDALQAEQASEMRIQKGYESNPEAAREQAAWLENFRCDIIGQALADYLKENKTVLEWLIGIRPGASGLHSGQFPDMIHGEQEPPHIWLACLYYVLHLVPVDDVSRLMHQFRKWGVLEQQAGHTEPDENVEALKSVIALYLDMHDGKHDGSGVQMAGLAPFEELFEKPADFETTFVTEGSTDDHLAATRRGLREIMRFGHLGVLNGAIRMNRISSADISDLAKLERIPVGGKPQDSEIARAQLKRKSLHSDITTTRWTRGTDRQAFNAKMKAWIDEYPKHLDLIRRHRSLANKVRLNNHIRLHRLMVRIVSRLIDYAGTWERDGYFISLALMRLHGFKPEDVIFPDPRTGRNAAKAFRNSGQLPPGEDMLATHFCELLKRFHTQKHRNIRNDLHHFNILAGDDVDLTKAVNQVRRLMAYDRKQKNAISSSIIDLMFEEGLVLKWEMDESHQLTNVIVRSRDIKHLANHLPKSRNHSGRETKEMQQKFTEPFHESAFVAMICQLFSPDPPQKTAK